MLYDNRPWRPLLLLLLLSLTGPSCIDPYRPEPRGTEMPMAEVCDGTDNDDNGVVDDIPGHEPIEQTCDGVDNDCDGLTDEVCECQPATFQPEPLECGLGACRRLGLTACVDGHVRYVCESGPPAPDDSRCDGQDDDCDGATDEDCECDPATFQSDLLECGLGDCRRVGATACVNGMIVARCEPGPPAPEGSRCDGRDNDCDGQLDEGVACFSGPSLVLASLGLGAPDQGFDLNGDGLPDNAIGKIPIITQLLGPMFEERVQDGEFIILGEFAEAYDWRATSGVALKLFSGRVADDRVFQPDRDLSGQGIFEIEPGSLDEQGQPRYEFADGTLRNFLFQGQRPTIPLSVEAEGADLHLLLHLVRLHGRVVPDVSGLAAMTDGLFGGALRRDELRNALDAAREQGAELPIESEQIVMLLGAPDIDTDGNGELDAFSLALSFTAVQATIVGIAAP